MSNIAKAANNEVHVFGHEPHKLLGTVMHALFYHIIIINYQLLIIITTMAALLSTHAGLPYKVNLRRLVLYLPRFALEVISLCAAPRKCFWGGCCQNNVDEQSENGPVPDDVPLY